jgi:hypothetical protein
VPVGPGHGEVPASPGRFAPGAISPMVTGPSAPNGSGNGHGPNGSQGLDLRIAGLGRRPDVEYVSPLRGGATPEGGPLERPGSAVSTLPRISPAEPVATYAETPGSAELVDHDVEPALPDEARSRAAAEASATTEPLEAAPLGSVLHVRFGGAPATQLVSAMETFRQLARERPGDTRVVVYVPAQGGSALPMELRTGIAYDADLLAEVRRRLGDTGVQLSVAPPNS